MLSRRFLIDLDFATWIFGGVMQMMKRKHVRHGRLLIGTFVLVMEYMEETSANKSSSLSTTR